MPNLLNSLRTTVRGQARKLAAVLDKASGGRLTPAMVTIAGLVMHLPIAVLVALGHDYWAAGLLVVFGLFDVLDGALAAVQGRASARGMLLDASTDRMKETLLYSGAAYALATGPHPTAAAWAAAALGASLCVSYVKAKGEAAVASGSKQIPHATLNRMFADGFLTFEIRMAIFVFGLVAHQLLYAMAFVAVFASITAIQRLVRISRQL